MFKVRWCQFVKKDRNGFQLVNLKKEVYSGDKFILASHADQCFYIKDAYSEDTWIAIRKPPRSLFDSHIGENYEEDDEDIDTGLPAEYEPNFSCSEVIADYDDTVVT